MNPNKKKGTRAETKIVNALQDAGLVAERRALAGASDVGDIKVELDDDKIAIIEVKAGKQTQAPCRSLLSIWLKQTKNELINSGAHYGALVVCVYNRSVKDYPVYVYVPDVRFPLFMHFDEFIHWLKDGRQ